jgi:hypothetical protein
VIYLGGDAEVAVDRGRRVNGRPNRSGGLVDLAAFFWGFLVGFLIAG